MTLTEVRAELVAAGLDDGPSLEAYAGQILRLRDAQARLATEGVIIADPKGNPIPHPALEIERKAQAEIRAWAERMSSTRRRVSPQ